MRLSGRKPLMQYAFDNLSFCDFLAVIGIHDMHDSGAALAEAGVPVSAINEERFTKKKNDVGFPMSSVRFIAGIEGYEIDKVAVPWIGGSALISRLFPGFERKRRMLWRHECRKPGALNMRLRNIAFKLIQDQHPRAVWKAAGEGIGGRIIRKRLMNEGIGKDIVFVEHHLAHAAGAYFGSGFGEALIVTLDGAGDGLSGTVSIGDNGSIERICSFNASASLGILYGAATLACDFRYGEDEGKLMSLAAYSYPTEIEELNDIARYDPASDSLRSASGAKYEFLLAEKIRSRYLWKYGREAVAYAVQKHLEEQVMGIVRKHIKETKIHNLAVAGGVFSNIKLNMAIDGMPEVKDFFVFPHMGDGGLALGAAYYVDFQEMGKLEGRQLENICFGPSYGNGEIENVLKKSGRHISYHKVDGIERHVAELIVEKNRIVLWFQGNMEYGPRALGSRSVLAYPGDEANRDRINSIIKKRPYFQPFASSILHEDAGKVLSPYRRPNRFMTVGYVVDEHHRKDLAAAMHIDSTTRPQVVTETSGRYYNLLKHVKRLSGVGALLNTSLNKHGYPIVMTPEDAVWTLLNTGADTLAIGDYIVEKR